MSLGKPPFFLLICDWILKVDCDHQQTALHSWFCPQITGQLQGSHATTDVPEIMEIRIFRTPSTHLVVVVGSVCTGMFTVSPPPFANTETFME